MVYLLDRRTPSLYSTAVDEEATSAMLFEFPNRGIPCISATKLDCKEYAPEIPYLEKRTRSVVSENC